MDEEKVASTVKEVGFNPYKQKLLGITDMKSMLDKNRFNDLLGNMVVKKRGKLKLVTRGDKRPEVASLSELLIHVYQYH